MQKGPKTQDECCTECLKKKGCTSFHIGKLKEGKSDCFLFSHTAVIPVKSLKGACYRVTRGKGKQWLLILKQFDALHFDQYNQNIILWKC